MFQITTIATWKFILHSNERQVGWKRPWLILKHCTKFARSDWKETKRKIAERVSGLRFELVNLEPSKYEAVSLTILLWRFGVFILPFDYQNNRKALIVDDYVMIKIQDRFIPVKNTELRRGVWEWTCTFVCSFGYNAKQG